LPLLSFSQNEKIKITYGAENENIPAIGDTIISNNPKSIKFQDGKNFIIEEYFENKKKSKSTVFPLDNLKFKTLTKYNENGKIILIASYNNGIVDGAFKKFYENGILMEEGEYKMMKKVGLWKYYDETGNLTKTEEN
jgi:antitoxin component YwqK of YwqJK toxin-antitoxin module